MVMAFPMLILRQLLKFHKEHKKHLTVTAVRPPARFGYLSLEKIQLLTLVKRWTRENWINGGFL